jgi:hypothetical protein
VIKQPTGEAMKLGSGLFEDLCAPADEVEKFDRLVRDPAGGVAN